MTSPSTQRTNAMDTPVVVASRKARYDIYPQSHHQLHQPGTSSSPRTFDMKTLLAKPAPPYARGNGYGSGSESEGAGRISSERDRRVRTRTRSRQAADESASAEGKEITMNELTFDHGSPPLNLSLELAPVATSSPSPKPSLNMERTTSRTTMASATNPSSPVSVPASPTKPNKRVRNVLKRRPSVVKDREREVHRSAHTQELPTSPVPPISTKPSSSMLRLSNIRIPSSPLFAGRNRSRSPSSSSPRNPSTSTSPWSSSAIAMSSPSSVWPSPPVATPSSPNPNVRRKPVDYSKLSNPTHAEMPVLTDSMTRKSGPTTTERTRGTSRGERFKQAEVDPDKPPSSRRSSSNKGTMSPPPGSPIRRFPLFGSSSSKPNSPSPVPSSSSAGSSVLTPAGAVADAYRRQVASAQAAERPYPYRLPASSNSSLSFGRPLDNRSTDALSLGLLSNTTLDDDDQRSWRWGHSRRMRDGTESDREDGTGFDIITRHHLSPPASASGHDQQEETLLHHIQENPTLKQLTEEEESIGPYYSVLGSTTGRLIAVGGPDDHHLSWTPELSANLLRRSSGANILGSGRSADTSTVNAGSSGGAVGVVKTLTRKVSGRFRRSGEGNDGAKDDRRRSQSRRGLSVERGGERKKDRRDTTSKGRPSLQEDRSGYFSAGESSRKSSRRQRAMSPDTRALEAQKQQYRRSLRLSIDKFADEDLHVASTKPLSRTSSVSASRVSKQTPSKSRRTKSAFGGTASTIDHQVSQQISNAVSSGATSFPNDPPVGALSSPSPASASSNGGGSRIWKLMKRISTGGLREKYSQTQQLADAPPVPPLPPVQTTAAACPPIITQKHIDRTPRASLNPPPKSDISEPTASIAPEATFPIATPQRSRVTSPTSPSQQSPGQSSAHSHAQSSNMTRPSTTTRSSSPSSAMFSTYSAPLQASGYSSASSLPNSAHAHGADESDIPPLPKFAQWIVPPSELKKMYEETPAGAENDQLSQNRSSARRHKLRLTMPAAPSPSSLIRPSYGEDYAMLPTPSAQLASLPVPPRRPRTAPTSPSAEAMKFASSAFRSPSKDSFLESSDADDEISEDPRAPSPDIPTFSTAAPINAFRTRKSSNNITKARPSPVASGTTQASPSTYNSPAGSTGALSPPPRPTRSRMRPAPSPPDSAGLLGAISSSTTCQESPASAPDLKRRSTSAQSAVSTATARPIETRHTRHRSGSLSLFRLSASLSGSSGVSVPSPGGARTRISSTPSSPQKAASERLEEQSKNGFFRSFGRMTGKQLTDKEKNDRWEDLLQRSDRAGGTLHLEVVGGEHGLSSDQLRFSQLTIDDN